MPQFNGNISAQYWGTGTNLSNNFAYTYDKLNRLTSGQATGMSEMISYDVMGNIKKPEPGRHSQNLQLSGQSAAASDRNE